MIRLLTIDDHPIVRAGIRNFLAQASDIEVAGEAIDGEDGLRQALEIRPHVILLDISLPGSSGLEVLKTLKRDLPKAAVLILSMHPESQYAIPLLREGASGYLSKQAPAETLIEAIRKVSRGGRYINAETAESLAFRLDPDFERPPHERLSGRELEILRRLASGKTLPDIGNNLGLSVNTIRTYRGRILRKMEFSSTAEMVRYACQQRLVEIPPQQG